MRIEDLQPLQTCCFTGHRPNKLPAQNGEIRALYRLLRARLKEEVIAAYQSGYTHFLCGMALGADTWAAEEVLHLKAAGEPVFLVAAIPCADQDMAWNSEDRYHYRRLMEQVDGIYCACDTYTDFSTHTRNRWMVEHASRIIAVYNGTDGGTASTLKMARHRELELRVVSF